MGKSYAIPQVENLPTTVIVKEDPPIVIGGEVGDGKDDADFWRRKCFELEAKLLKYEVDSEIVKYNYIY